MGFRVKQPAEPRSSRETRQLSICLRIRRQFQPTCCKLRLGVQAGSRPRCSGSSENRRLGRLGLTRGVFWEEVTVDDGQLVQGEGSGGPFLSTDEGPLKLQLPGSFPVRTAQQRVPDL